MKQFNNHTIYQIIDQTTNDELFINFKPTKQDLISIALTRTVWSGLNEKNIKKSIKDGLIFSHKLCIKGK
jgi:hypothetical protein